jgi:hypothetical protein
MTRNTLAAVLCAGLTGLAAQGLSGCARDDHPTRGRPAQTKSDQAGKSDRPAGTGTTEPASADENRHNAEEKLRQATDAEAQGDYTRAIEALEYLRDFPEDVRPKDLEQRIRHVRQKMDAAGQ